MKQLMQNHISLFKTILLLSLITTGFLSCKSSEKEVDTLEIAKTYYAALNHSDASEIKALLADSLLTKETEYNYEQTFSRKEYLEWLKWDSVFDPTYEILEIKQENGVVKASISKLDKRIAFLHQEPIVTHQVIRFDGDKIASIETTQYLVFNDSVFVQKRDDLLNWIDTNHPELNGFINDQTRAGGEQYLKAIELYQNTR